MEMHVCSELSELGKMLAELGLSEYVTAFKQHEVELGDILQLDANELKGSIARGSG